MKIFSHRSAWLGLALLLYVPLLGWAIQQGWTSGWDWAISDQLSLRGNDQYGIWAQLLQGVTWVGHFGPRSTIALLLALVIYRWRGMLAAIIFGITPFVASGYSSLLKAIFDRPRPDLIEHLDAVSSASYPSGHATGAVLIYLIFAMAAPRPWRWPAAILAAAMISLTAVSRVALGVHWASDIIGGIGAGLGFALLVRPYLTTPLKQ